MVGVRESTCEKYVSLKPSADKPCSEWHLIWQSIAMNHELLIQLMYAGFTVIGGWLAYHVFFYFIKRWARQKKRMIPGLLSRYLYYPGLIFTVLLTLWLSLMMLYSRLSLRDFMIARHMLQILIAAATCFLLMRAVTVLREIAIHHYSKDHATDYSLRKAKTKFQLMQRIFNFLLILGTTAVVLMTFDSIRQVGATLLASAGVVGLVIGFAAQKSLGTLFAGIQIAVSQPIRIDDLVMVEKQSGVISEITLTYVVINTWDGRRLVVPINYFLEKPFENWTRVSPEIVGTVKLYADYTLPVDSLRQQLKRWLDTSPLWDRRSWSFYVNNADSKTIELMATMSARNSGDAYALESQVLEMLIAYMQTHYPQCLPQSRVKVER